MAITTSEDVRTTLEALFPIRGRTTHSDTEQSHFCSLELAVERKTFEHPNGSIWATLHLFVWETSNGEESIQTIKEQEVAVVPAATRDRPEIVRAYLQGWAQALATVLPELSSAQIDSLMPYGLVFAGAATLRKAATAQDFCKAFLVKSRLGKFRVGVASPVP
jgi:hypothetical protein